jgi:hypothetical protein
MQTATFLGLLAVAAAVGGVNAAPQNWFRSGNGNGNGNSNGNGRGSVPSSGFATPGVNASYDYVGKNYFRRLNLIVPVAM